MMPSPAELFELMNQFESTVERPRYTLPKINQEWPRKRSKKYQPWKVEMLYVPWEIWRLYAHETQRGYYGGKHGSRRLYIVSYEGEEMGRFTTMLQAKDYITDKENT